MKIVEYNLYRGLFDDSDYYGVVEFDLGDSEVLRKKLEGKTFESVKSKVDEYIKSKE